MELQHLTISEDGAQVFRAALSRIELKDFDTALAPQPQDQAGVRLCGIPEVRPFLDPTGPRRTV